MHNPFVSMLHLFQSHRYYVALFFRALLKKPQYIFSSDIRQRIDWTPKAKVLFFLAWLLYLGIVVFFTITYSLNYLQILCISTLLLFLFPIYLVSVHRIIAPFQHIYVAYILQKAKFKLRNRSDLIVIAIVGSYGKTTQKEILSALLSNTHHVLSTTGNQNTPIGIAKSILHNLTKEHQIYIVEMGEDHLGDIKQLCELTRPHIGIVTGITKQHMDTFDSYEEVIATLGELFTYMGSQGEIIVHQPFQEFSSYYSLPNVHVIPSTVLDQTTYLPNLEGISFPYKEHLCTVPLLAKHNVYPILAACHIGNILGINDSTLMQNMQQLYHIKHRLEPLYNPNTDIWVIDDTYNGNIEGFKSGIDLLLHTNCIGCKWYITPGLSAVGDDSESIHYDLGKLLARAAQRVILIQNAHTSSMYTGLVDAGFDAKNIYMYSSTQEAHLALSSLLHRGDIILFQNDIPDLLI